MAYNNTKMNERRIELPIAFDFVDNTDGNIIEVGNVLRHYKEDYNHDVLDLDEESYFTIKKDILKWKPRKKYSACVSISTIEHTQNPLLAVQRILTFAPKVLITFPIGYKDFNADEILDKFENLYFMKRINKPNEWIETTKEEARKLEYVPDRWANAIAILIKGYE